MKVIVAGSRSITDLSVVEEAIHLSGFTITEVVCGDARGVDSLGEEWADLHDVPVKHFPADWSQGKMAGFSRNNHMADYAEALVAVWDSKSKGTGHMIAIARSRKLPVFVHTV
ncbi:MAG: SLOG family protein [Spirochaetota bacterium]